MKYLIKKKKMGGVDHWMIYQKLWFLPAVFFERWNTPESAEVRLKELQNDN